MAVGEPDTFRLPEGFGAEIPEYRNMALLFAGEMVFRLMSRGFGTDEAHSQAAHLLLDAAYGTAFVGAMTGGRSPNPDRFMEAAQMAVDRLDAEATTRAFMESEGQKDGAT